MYESDILWLNITNAALGIATAICVAVVAWGVVTEVMARLRAKAAAANPLAADDHAFAVPGLGFTMADGGHKVDEKGEEK